MVKEKKKEITKEEARYYSDKSTLEGSGAKYINGFKEGTGLFPEQMQNNKHLNALNVLPENYERWAKEQNKKIRKEIKSYEISPKIKGLLDKEKLWDFIVIDELDKKHIGDIKTKEVIFLDCLGRLVKNKKPYSFNALIQATSSAGKDHLLDAVLDLIIKLDVERYGNMSPKALKYLHNKRKEPEWDYNGKIISIEEVNEKTMNDEVIKILTSADKKSGSVANNRGETIEIKGNPVIFMTSASAIPTPEILNRFSLLGLDESEEQTKRTFFVDDKPYSEEVIDFLADLDMCEVMIPFEKKLAKHFPYNKQKYKRLFPKLKDYIKAIACFHQAIRKHHHDGSIDAELKDYDIAKEVFMNSCAGVSTIHLKEIDKKIVETLEKHEKPLGAREINQFTEKYISQQNLYDHVKALANQGVLEEFELRDPFNNALTKYALSEEFRDKSPIKLPDSSKL